MKKRFLTMIMMICAIAISALGQGYGPSSKVVQGKAGQLFAISAQPRKDGKLVSYEAGSAVWSSSNQAAAKVEGYKTINGSGQVVDGTELQALVTLQAAGSFVIVLTIRDGDGNDVVGMFIDRAVTGAVITIQLVPTAAIDPL